MRSGLYKLSGVLVCVLFVYLAVRRVDPAETLRVLTSSSPLWLLAAALVYLVLALPVRAERWRRLLRSQKKLPFGRVLVPMLVGQMANNLLPARTGELYRAHFLGRREGMSRSGAVGSIVVERTLDGLVLVALILAVFLLYPANGFLGFAALATGAVILALAAGIAVHSFASHKTGRLVYRGVSFLPGNLPKTAGHRLEAFLGAVRGTSTVQGFLVVGLFTACAWLIEAGTIALILGAFGLSLSLGGFVLVYALSALAAALPSGPAYLGPYQYAFVLSLGASGVSGETAIAVSVAAQVALFGSVAVAGLLLLFREQLRGATR